MHRLQVIYRITSENLAVRNSVLLDVPHITHMQKEDWRTFIQELAERNQATLVVIRCRVDEKTLRKRLQDRSEPRDAWKLANWSEFLSREPIDVFIPFPHLDVDISTDPEGTVNDVIRYIVNCVESRPYSGFRSNEENRWLKRTELYRDHEGVYSSLI